MDNRESVIFVTGASSGIGNASAALLAKKGMKVYGTCRNPSTYAKKADEFFEMLPMDLRDGASVAKAAEKVLEKEGRIDALVCCAGSGMVGSVEETGVDEARDLMDADYFGVLRVVKAFLPAMREAKSGKILIAGAMEGRFAAPFQSAYSAAEFALEALAQSLRMELGHSGVAVSTLEFAAFRTGFGQARRVIAGEDSPYKAAIGNALGILGRDEADGSDPFLAAKTVLALLEARRMPERKVIGPRRRRLLSILRRHFGASPAEALQRRYFRID